MAAYQGADVVAAIGPKGPYLRYQPQGAPKAQFVSIPPEMSPYTITAEEALQVIEAQAQRNAAGPIAEFPQYDIQIINGRYGPYIKCAGENYKIPRGTDPATLDAESAKALVDQSSPTTSKRKVRRKARS